MTNNNKTIITGLMIGGLALSAPLAAMAASDFGSKNINDQVLTNNMYSDEMMQNRLDMLESALELQIEHANTLIDNLDVDDNVNVDELKAIVDEFAQLELSLNELGVDEEAKEDFRAMFFEIQTESRSLSENFRTTIQDAFTQEEMDELRTEFQTEKQELKAQFGIGSENNNMRSQNKGNSLNEDGTQKMRGEGMKGEGAGSQKSMQQNKGGFQTY